jgi:hypothetical protein
MKYYCKNCGSEFTVNDDYKGRHFTGFWGLGKCPVCEHLRLEEVPAYETVDQWEKRTGQKYPDIAPVYVRFVNKFTDPKSVAERATKGKSYYWSFYEYGRTRAFRADNLIVLANELGPPPEGWRPVEGKKQNDIQKAGRN